MGVVEDLRADLEALLRAARFDFPEKAAAVSEAAEGVADEIERLNPESALAGDPQVLRDALRFCGDIHEGLRKLVEGLDYCSTGLIQMVDNYRQTDVEAAAAYSQISTRYTQGSPPAAAVVPTDMGNPETPGSYSYPDLIPSTRQPDDPDATLAEHDRELGARPEPGLPELPL